MRFCYSFFLSGCERHSSGDVVDGRAQMIGMRGERGRTAATRTIVSVTTFLLLPTAIGCTSAPPPRLVHQDALTVIQLRVDTKAEQEHSHPAAFIPEQVREVLDGIRLQKRGEPVFSLIAGQPEVVPAFSKTESLALSTPISRALAMASPKELVTFYRRVSDAQIVLGYTTGGIFVQDGLIFVVLANYRAKPFDALVRDVPMYPIDPVEDPLLSLGTTVYSLSYARPEAEVHPVQWSGRYDRAKTLVVNPILAHRNFPPSTGTSRP